MTRMGTAFLPEFHEGRLTVQANTLPGTSLAKSDEIGRRVEQILLAQPEVVATARRTGRAEYDEHVQGVEAAEIDVGLRETGRPRAELLADLRRGFSTLPGTNVTIGQPISHRIDHMLSGTRANIAVKVFGDDLPTLRRLGERVRGRHGRRARGRGPVARAADGHSVRPLRAQSSGDRPLRPARRRCGEAVETALRGDGRPHLRRGTAFDLVVKFDPRLRPTSTGSAICRSTRRTAAPCRSGCSPTCGAKSDPNMILRENVQRRIVISANVAGRDLGSVVDGHSVSGRPRGTDAGRLPRRVRRPVRKRAERVAAPAGAGRRRRRRPVHAAGPGVRPAARRLADHAQPAARADRRRRRRVPRRRRAERRVDDRLHHAVRHRHAQRDHARVAHPAPDAGRKASPTSARPSSAGPASGWCRF